MLPVSGDRAPLRNVNFMPAKQPATRPSRTDRRTERRKRIIEAAARLFADLGFAGCEMERVAADLGIAKGTLYLYFPGKQDLFFACVDLGMQQMQTAVKNAAATATDPFEIISRAIRAYLA